MPFDALVMAAMAEELSGTIVGGQIQRIIQPSLHSIGIATYAGGNQCWLLLSADAQNARVSLVNERLAKAFPTPSAFVMLLRKHLEGGRVRSVSQVPHERILRVECGTHEDDFVLVAEVMGKHSNVILIDKSSTVLGAIKAVPPRLSRVRPILPGRPYSVPPPRGRATDLYGEGSRIDPAADFDAFLSALRGTPAMTTVSQALGGILPGASPFLVHQIEECAGLSGSQELQEIDVRQLTDVAARFLRLPQTHDWHPTSFHRESGKTDFAPFVPLGVPDIQAAETMSEAIERVIDDEVTRDPLSTVRGQVTADAEHAARNAGARLRSLQQGLDAAQEADAVMETGQLVLAYGYSLPRGSADLYIPDLERRIALNPRLSPSENAERMFRRYKKLRDAQKRIPGMIVEARADQERLQEVVTFARIATSEADLRALQRELRPEPPTVTKTRQKGNVKRGPARYKFEGWTAIAGRSANENEEVTFRLASGDDLWFHAHERTGSHVVLQRGSRAVPDSILEATAGLAAYLSEGRTDTAVDVDYAAVRDVRKVPGGPAGRVTYRNSRTIRTRPSLGEWTRSSS